MFPTHQESLFTNCHEFQRVVCRLVTKETKLVRIASYNVGIGVEYDTVDSFIQSMCVATKVQLLVGFNPKHEKNTEISLRLSNWHKRHSNLEIRRYEKLHAKIVSITNDSTKTWIGSLNLITPTLFDIMAKLTPEQSNELMKWFDRLWQRAPVLFIR